MLEVPKNVDEAVRKVIRESGTITGIRKLRDLTGMGIREAKEWIEESGEGYARVRGVCPYCGLDIRTTESKQCRHCLRDWHNEANLRRLGTDQLWGESE